MRAGQLRHRITLQRAVDAQDDYGEPSSIWEDVVSIAAAIEPISGREFFSAQQVQADVTTRITIRWRNGIEPVMRIVHATAQQAAMSPPQSTIYDIEAILPDPTGRRQIVFMCRNRNSEGFRSGT
jgi:SPP1 family predicted phage head-tail adaptor